MYKLKRLMMICVFCFCSVGCISQSDKLKVTVIVKSTTSQFFKSVASGANAASKEYNIDLTFEGPENEEDYHTQINMIEQAVKRNEDAIVLSAIDYNKLVEPVEKAIATGIPVIIIDSDVHSDKVQAKITTNNYTAGEMAGSAINSLFYHDIVVGIVNFDANTANGQERETGFRDSIKENKDIENIYSVNVQSNINSTIQGTKELLANHPDIDALVTFNEWTTLGVGEAIKDMQIASDIFVVGFDNNPISVGMLETGEVDTLIVQNPFAMGYLGVEQAQNIVRKGIRNTEPIYTKTVLINKRNMFDQEIQKIVFPFN